jgi:hypothetical protein
MKPRVLISIPTSTGFEFVRKEMIEVCIKLTRDNRCSSLMIFPSFNPLANNLHHIINILLKGDYTHWLNIDSDNPPFETVLDLVFLDKDIIGCPTPIWHWRGGKDERPVYLNAYDFVKAKGGYVTHRIKQGLQRVDAIGGGCFIAKREVFEHPDMVAPFHRQWKEDGTVHKGGDFNFCEKARASGFEIWADYDYKCDHFYTLGMTRLSKAFNEVII